jgi:hypothetical protein
LDDEPEQTAQEEDGSGEGEGVEVAEPEGTLVDDEEPDAIELEELLPDINEDPILDYVPRDWLEVDGTAYRKSSVVAQRLKANRSKKVVERTLRVQGLTLDDIRKRSSTDIQTDSTNSDQFCVGDIAATLAHSGSSVCLTIIQAISIRKKNSSLHSIATHLLWDQESDFSVQAQVVQLVQTGSLWVWPPHQFLKVSKPKKQSSNPTIHDFTVTCPGWVCFPVNPDIRAVSDLFPDNEPTSIPNSSPDRTWVLTGEDLNALTEHIWGGLKSDSTHDIEAMMETLPLIENPDALPYEDWKGQPFPFIIPNIH